jgi:aminoglycoside phosphotransferase (APT) family kinase protein
VSATVRREHPAMTAWTALGRPAVTTVVETLKDRPKSSVYRLHGIGPAGGDVVAKRTRRPLARREHLVLTRVLPGLGVPALRALGYLEAGPDSSWVFVDHCAGTPFGTDDPGHRILAAHWFARLHLRGLHAADAGDAAGLADLRLGTYLAHLRAARAQVRAAGSAPVRRGGDDALPEALLEQVAAGCDALEDVWGEVEAACGGLPSTLVHGDARAANLLVRTGREGPEPVPIDWAEAGWGPAVVDLAQVDGATYWALIGGAWGDVDPGRHEQFRAVASTFQWLVGIDKVTTCLTDPSYLDRARDHLGWFRDHLDRALPVIRGIGSVRA